MKVVITGGTGNVGTSLVERLSREPAVDEIVAVARHAPGLDLPKTRFWAADVGTDDLSGVFAGAAAVVHLAWAIQPRRDERLLHRTNVVGSERVFEAAIAARVPTLVHASSVGVYSAAPRDRVMDESWPRGGIDTSLYSRQKAIVEGHLDRLEREHPEVRLVVMRPALTFQRSAASEIKRYFAGRLVPSFLFARRRILMVPDLPELRLQAVHASDVAEAFRAALLGDVRGAFNLAAPPVLDSDALAKLLGARKVPIRAATLRRLVDASYRLHLQPSEPGWLDLALRAPVMDSGRARRELHWDPKHSAADAFLELLEGIEAREGIPAPPLRPAHPRA